MKKLLAFREAYLRNEDGATAIEYGLAIVSIVFIFGADLNELFTTMQGKLADANADAAAAP